MDQTHGIPTENKNRRNESNHRRKSKRNDSRRLGLEHALKERQRLVAAVDDVLREDGLGAAQPHARRNLGRRKAVGDRHARHAGLDQAEVDGHGFGRHRHADADRVADRESHAVRQCVRDAVRERLEVRERPRVQLARRVLERKHDGRVRGRALRGAVARGREARLGNVEARAGQVAHRLEAALGRGRRLKHGAVGRVQRDLRALLDRVRPEALARVLGDREAVELVELGDAVRAHRRRNVALLRLGLGRRPQRRGLGVETGIVELEHLLVQRPRVRGSERVRGQVAPREPRVRRVQRARGLDERDRLVRRPLRRVGEADVALDVKHFRAGKRRRSSSRAVCGTTDTLDFGVPRCESARLAGVAVDALA